MNLCPTTNYLHRCSVNEGKCRHFIQQRGEKGKGEHRPFQRLFAHIGQFLAKDTVRSQNEQQATTIFDENLKGRERGID